MPGYLDRRRASQLMMNEGLSALVLCQPESISYAAGAFPGVATFWRRAGAAFLVVPADEQATLTAIVGDLQASSFAAQSGIEDVRSQRIWVETDRFPLDATKPKRSPRPAQFDLAVSLNLLADVLKEKGCEGERVGLELGFVPAADFESFRQLPFTWVDCTRIVERLRSIKSVDEIGKLHRAANYAAKGMQALFSSIEPGMTAQTMTGIWQQAALAEAARAGETSTVGHWAYIAVGGDGFAPGGPATQGDIIKIDVGCIVEGYSSDGARTAVLGSPRPEAQQIFDALHRAFDLGLEHFKPGTHLSDIYKLVSGSMWQQGYDTYNRGHFGHGVGASIWSEEWPFISAESDAVLEPGMVLAFETPWYIEGLGGFIIEDQLLVTQTGFEVMAPMPRGLVRC